MKYRILLNGTNKTVIEDFFTHSNEFLDFMTTSMRWDDISHHIQYLEMDAFCYCAANDSEEYISQVFSLKEMLKEHEIPFVFIGSEEDRIRYESGKVIEEDDLVILRPIRVFTIEDNIFTFLEEKRLAEEKRLEEERRVEEERRRIEEEERRRAAEEEERLAREAELNRKRRILVIDDDSVMLKAILEQLQEQYEVGIAINGRVALKYLEKKAADLILLDYEMPSVKGPDILEKIRENEATKDIPVIFLTRVTERDKIMPVLSLKPQGYLVKPIDHNKLISEISKALNGGEQE